MRSVMSEIRKSLYPPLFVLSCLGVVCVCCLGEGYTSAGGKTYTIIELLLFLRRDAMLVDISLNRYDIWMRGIGAWTQLLLPLLLSMGYLYTLSAEKTSGFVRMLLIRENHVRYGASKLLAAMTCGGVVLSVGYLLFGMLVYIKMPGVYEYPADQLNLYLERNPGFTEAAFCLLRLLGVFFYGVCINAFAYLVSVFFRDKYILICLPLMLKYTWGQIVMKLEADAMNQGNDTVLNLCAGLRTETILHIRLSASMGMQLLLTGLVYLTGFLLTLHFLKKRGEGFGFE